MGSRYEGIAIFKFFNLFWLFSNLKNKLTSSNLFLKKTIVVDIFSFFFVFEGMPIL